jgi:phenylacetate-CoA ligase
MNITPLHAWVEEKIGCTHQEFGLETLERYQLDRLQHVIGQVKVRSTFYRQFFAAYAGTPQTLQDITRYPFTHPQDIQNDPNPFLCVSQDEIQRIVTLPTSGTTGPSKRIFFTASDQELTIDFFRVGMSTLAKPGDRVLILLPWQRPGSVGYLLRIGLERLGCDPYPYGLLDDESTVLKLIHEKNINVIVGAPVHLHRLAAWDHAFSILSRGQIEKVLSSTDMLPGSILRNLQRWWGCEVFDHYGMTETGLGGGVECEAHEGYHLREADLYYEIVDPFTGANLPDGELGEVVFTTLTRLGMPLVRYRTGDISRLLTGICGCGSFIKRLERISRRISSGIDLKPGMLYPNDLDEALFKLDGLLDFSTTIESKLAKNILSIDFYLLEGGIMDYEERIIGSLRENPTIKNHIDNESLELRLSDSFAMHRPQAIGPFKRFILNKDHLEN